MESARLAPMPDPDKIASIEDFDHWVYTHGKQATPILLWGIFLGLARGKREALEAKIATLETRLAELEQRPSVEYCGVWAADRTYALGALVTHGGSIWHSNVHENRAQPGEHAHWTLAVKRGKDGKDGRDGQGTPR